MMQNSAHKRALQVILKEDLPLFPVVVFGKDAQLHTDVALEHPMELIHLFDLKRTVGKCKDQALDNRQVDQIYELLLPYVTVSEDIKKAHVLHTMNKRH